MFLGSGVRCGNSAGVVAVSSAVTTSGPRRERIMEILIVAIVAIVSFGLYRFVRTRAAH
jgi:hypothetical protein